MPLIQTYSGKIFFLIFLLSNFSILPQRIFAQTSDFSISAGLSTLLITGDNVAREPLRDFHSVAPLGGSLSTTHPGIALRLTYFLDPEKNFRLPIGFDYYFLSGAQRVILNPQHNDYFINNLQIPTTSIGLNYAFLEFPFASARMYGGFELRGSFIPESGARWEKYVIKTGELLDGRSYAERTETDDPASGKTGGLHGAGNKKSTFRIGGALRLGVEGQVYEQYYVNISAAYGRMNFNADDKRRELLTPNFNIESKESPVDNFLVSVMVEYRL